MYGYPCCLGSACMLYSALFIMCLHVAVLAPLLRCSATALLYALRVALGRNVFYWNCFTQEVTQTRITTGLMPSNVFRRRRNKCRLFALEWKRRPPAALRAPLRGFTHPRRVFAQHALRKVCSSELTNCVLTYVVVLFLQAITSGFFYNTSKMSKSGDYKTIKNQHTVYIHPSSVLHKQEVKGRCLFLFSGLLIV